jgi:hypothetical protein
LKRISERRSGWQRQRREVHVRATSPSMIHLYYQLGGPRPSAPSDSAFFHVIFYLRRRRFFSASIHFSSNKFFQSRSASKSIQGLVDCRLHHHLFVFITVHSFGPFIGPERKVPPVGLDASQTGSASNSCPTPTTPAAVSIAKKMGSSHR